MHIVVHAAVLIVLAVVLARFVVHAWFGSVWIAVAGRAPLLAAAISLFVVFFLSLFGLEDLLAPTIALATLTATIGMRRVVHGTVCAAHVAAVAAALAAYAALAAAARARTLPFAAVPCTFALGVALAATGFAATPRPRDFPWRGLHPILHLRALATVRLLLPTATAVGALLAALHALHVASGTSSAAFDAAYRIAVLAATPAAMLLITEPWNVPNAHQYRAELRTMLEIVRCNPHVTAETRVAALAAAPRLFACTLQGALHRADHDLHEIIARAPFTLDTAKRVNGFFERRETIRWQDAVDADDRAAASLVLVRLYLYMGLDVARAPTDLIVMRTNVATALDTLHHVAGVSDSSSGRTVADVCAQLRRNVHVYLGGLKDGGDKVDRMYDRVAAVRRRLEVFV